MIKENIWFEFKDKLENDYCYKVSDIQYVSNYEVVVRNQTFEIDKENYINILYQLNMREFTFIKKSEDK